MPARVQLIPGVPMSLKGMSLRSLMRWPEFRNFAAHSGPTMTVAGTSTKFAFLAVLFFIGAFFSWRHFHERAQQIERESLQVVAARSAGNISVEDAQKRMFVSFLAIAQATRRWRV